MSKNKLDEVKMVGIVLEINGEPHTVGPEQCESIYRALDRMFKPEEKSMEELIQKEMDESLASGLERQKQQTMQEILDAERVKRAERMMR